MKICIEAAREAAVSIEEGVSGIGELTARVLTDSPRCSKYFRHLAAKGALAERYPELAATIGVKQNHAFHPEGDVFEHTMRVIDAAAGLRGRAEEPLSLMYAALFHDLGKCVATEVRADGKIISHGHETKGLPLVESAMRRLTDDEELIGRVMNHVRLHMRPNMLRAADSRKRKTRTLFDLSLCPNDLILLSRADVGGMGEGHYNEAGERWLRDRLRDYEARMAVPHIDGRAFAEGCGLSAEEQERFAARARQLHLSGLDMREVERQLRAEAEAVKVRNGG